jgi:hypothetical protein
MASCLGIENGGGDPSGMESNPFLSNVLHLVGEKQYGLRREIEVDWHDQTKFCQNFVQMGFGSSFLVSWDLL